jgi:beta-lactamase class A
VLLGPLLRPQSRARLTDWLVGAKTGVARLKAGLPAGWRVGHKTGTGSNGTANDVAIVWPAGNRAPVLIAAYLTGSTLTARDRDSILAGAARAIAADFG